MDTGNVFQISLSSDADKYIRKQGKDLRKRIEDAIGEICNNPISGPNIKPMKINNNQYRYRLGNYRIIYRVYIDSILVEIIDIGPRGDVYK